MFLLDRDASINLKGIAIVLMILHHSLYGGIFDFAVVPMYAFLTGWSYFFHIDKTYRYSIKKIINFLLRYWIVYGLCLFLAVFFCNYDIRFFDVILEAFSIRTGYNAIMCFSWYVFFYIFCMLTLPLFYLIIKDKSKNKIFFISISIIIFMWILGSYIFYIRIYYFIFVIMGYLFAKYNIFDLIYNKMLKNQLIIYFFIMILLGSNLLHSNANNVAYVILKFIICVPMYILVMNHINFGKNYRIRSILNILGLNSVNMWFIHSIFFSAYTKQVFHPIGYIFGDSIISVIWIIVICLIVSKLLYKIQIFFINKVDYFIKIK